MKIVLTVLILINVMSYEPKSLKDLAANEVMENLNGSAIENG